MKKIVFIFMFLFMFVLAGKNSNITAAELPEEIRAAIEAAGDINAKDERGVTILVKAIRENAEPFVIKALLDAGADVKTRDKDGGTALMYAAALSNPEVIKLLVNSGADVKAQSARGDTALSAAFKVKNFNALLEIGADIQESEKAAESANSTMLILMLENFKDIDIDVVTALLKAGIDVNASDKYGDTALMKAVWGDASIDVIRALIKAGADVKARNQKGCTALMYAAVNHSNPYVIKTLLDAGSDIDASDGVYGMTPLMYAALNNNPEVVKALIVDGADVHARDNYGTGRKAIDHAQTRDKIRKDAKAKDIIAMLNEAMESHADKSEPKDNLTAEDFAEICRTGSVQAVKDALNRVKLSPNFKLLELPKFSYFGYAENPLIHIAAINASNPEIINLLSELGQDINLRSGMRTPLMLAAEENKNKNAQDIVSAFIENGADVNAVDALGRSALMSLGSVLLKINPENLKTDDAGLVNTEIFSKLISAGADVNAADDDGKTVLMYIVGHHGIDVPEEAKAKMTSELLKAGADVNAKALDGRTALIEAMSPFHSNEAIKLLLDAGADVNASTSDGTTALIKAARNSLNSNEETIKLLLDAGADVNARASDGATALIKAASSLHSSETIKWLLDAGADVNARASDGTTALIASLKHGSTTEDGAVRIDLLLNAGADVNARDNNGDTALTIAAADDVLKYSLTSTLEIGNEKEKLAAANVLNKFYGINSSKSSNSSEKSVNEPQYEMDFSELTGKLPPSLRSKGRLLITSSHSRIKGNNVRLRSAPTSSSKTIAQMNNGYIVKDLGLWQSDDGDWWEFIRTPDGKEGWVWGEDIEDIETRYQAESDPSQTANMEKPKPSAPVDSDPSDVQVNKLIAQNKIPLYIRDKGKFFYNPNMSMVRITGDSVRLRSQPNMKANVIARGSREMWGSIDYLGEWTHPNGDKWIVGLYDGWNWYPEDTPEWEKKIIWVSAKFARPITWFEYRSWQDSIPRAD